MKEDQEPVEPEIPEVNPEVSERAVRIYGHGEAMDEFPVLKAFQQYIDAEQSKARKRMLTLSIFFGLLMVIVIAVFLYLLMRVGSQNQKLNDRLVEYAIQEREREAEKKAAPPVVVQQPAQDSAAILALTSKIDDLQKKLAADQAKAEQDAKDAQARADKAIAEAQARADKATADALAAEKARMEAVKAAEDAAKAAKGPSDEEREIERLKALLAAEQKKQAELAEQEKERRRQEELEAYRRKHYPEAYQKKKDKRSKPVFTEEESEDVDIRTDDPADDEIDDEEEEMPKKKVQSRKRPSSDQEDILKVVDEILQDTKPVRYYEEEEPSTETRIVPPSRPKKTVQTKPVEKKSTESKPTEKKPVEKKPVETEEEYKIPVEVKGSRMTWQIPED